MRKSMRSQLGMACLLLAVSATVQAKKELTPEQVACKEMSQVAGPMLTLIEAGTIEASVKQVANLQHIKQLHDAGHYCEAKPYVLGLRGVLSDEKEGANGQ